MKVDVIRHARGVGRFQFPIEATQATTLAAANYELNRAALERRWPRTLLALPDALPELEWLYARDGTLSARHVDGHWLGDVSVPRKAAERMMAKLVVQGTTAVLLAPTHAAQVRAVLDRMTSRQTLIVVVPTESTAGAILACGDFSTEITAGRMWLACGLEWREELKAIFDAHEGIAPAGMMIRVPGLNAGVVDAILKPCKEVLASHGQTQRQRVSMIHGKPRSPATPPGKMLVAGGDFSLWQDAASILTRLARQAGDSAVLVDTASPLSASTLHFARQAEACDAIVTANLGRADLPPLVPENVPWTTWATHRVPAFVPAATFDRVIVADETLREHALAAGWPADRMTLAAEPTILADSCARAVRVLADCEPIVVPPAIEEMSSHRLVWELAEREIVADPLAARGTPVDFLHACADRLGVPRDTLPVTTLAETLLAPLWMREIVKGLRRRGVEFELYGKGWDAIPEVADLHRGPIESADDFDRVLRTTAAILDVWPTLPTHRARRTGRRMIRAWGRAWPAVIGDIRSGGLITRALTDSTPAFSWASIVKTVA